MRKLLLRCGLAPGDIVMMTAAVRDLHCCYPGRFITDVRTSCPAIWENNPYITPLLEEDPEVEQINCSYPLINRANHAPYHCLHGFIEFLNDRLKLAIKPSLFKGDIHLSAQEKAWYSQVHELTGEPVPFWIVAAGGKYDITIKWWQPQRYQEIVDHFRGRIQFIQVGNVGHHHPKLEGAIDLRGKTNLRELIRLVHHSQGVLCPVTSLMHLAAAVETLPDQPGERPCVVIAGGREPAHWEAYPGHQFIHTNGVLPCCSNGGCWKDRTLPLKDGDQRDRLQQRCVDVVEDLPRCMSMITPAEVSSRISTYFQGGMIKFLTAKQRKAAGRGVEASEKNNYDLQPLNRHSMGLKSDDFIKSIPKYPGCYQGRGIVICGGGTKYFTNAWISIRMLRKLGCELPVQLWHLGRREMDGHMQALVSTYGVECVDAKKVRKHFFIRILNGWSLKPYALLHSPFREVLLLDADNVPVINPEFLFGTPEYQRKGAIFWPDYDYDNRRKARPIWKSCGLVQPNEPEFESGQIVLDKERCWSALQFCVWLNGHCDYVYQHLHGDKETFHVAFRKMRQDYALVPQPIKTLLGTMCQHDFKGRRIFQHRNTAKWDLFGTNVRVPDFMLEHECRKFLKELRRLWSGCIA